MVKYINTFGTSYTEGGGFEWWKYPVVKNLYSKLGTMSYKNPSAFDFSWPGQLQKLFIENNQQIKVRNYARCGWGNERMYRKVYEIIHSKNFKREEHIFLFEFSDECRAEFWSVEKQKHFLVNYDYYIGPEREGLLYKQNVQPMFDYHQETFIDEEDYYKRIAPMMTEFIRETYDETDVHRRIEQNQIMFCSMLEYLKINWFVSFPNVMCYKPDTGLYYRFKDKLQLETKCNRGYQFIIKEGGWDFSTETNGAWKDFHGGFAWSKACATHIFNDLCRRGIFKLNPIYVDEEEIKKEIKTIVNNKSII